MSLQLAPRTSCGTCQTSNEANFTYVDVDAFWHIDGNPPDRDLGAAVS